MLQGDILSNTKMTEYDLGEDHELSDPIPGTSPPDVLCGIYAPHHGDGDHVRVPSKDFPASVYEIVLSGCQARGGRRFFYSAQEKQLAQENMEKMGITSLKDRCYRELSGGQQQRVLLARALCASRKILLLDEPVTGLDPVVSADLYALVEELNQQKLTIIMISHDIEAALRYASHILHISDHIFFGTKEEYLNSRAGRSFTAAAKEAENG